MIDLFLNSDLFRTINEYTDLRNLCDTCSFLSSSKQYINYKLNRQYSLIYYNDELFRNMILHKIFNPYKQLYLNLSYLGNTYDLDLRFSDIIINAAIIIIYMFIFFII